MSLLYSISVLCLFTHPFRQKTGERSIVTTTFLLLSSNISITFDSVPASFDASE